VDLSRHGARVLDAIQALRDKSMVFSYETVGGAGTLRLGLYLSIREYAAGKLEASGEAGAVHERHGRHYVREAQRWTASTEGPEGAAFLALLILEQENLIAAVDNALDGPGALAPERVELGLAGLVAMLPLLCTRISFVWALRVFEVGLARSEGTDRRLLSA